MFLNKPNGRILLFRPNLTIRIRLRHRSAQYGDIPCVDIAVRIHIEHRNVIAVSALGVIGRKHRFFRLLIHFQHHGIIAGVNIAVMIQIIFRLIVFIRFTGVIQVKEIPAALRHGVCKITRNAAGALGTPIDGITGFQPRWRGTDSVS